MREKIKQCAKAILQVRLCVHKKRTKKQAPHLTIFTKFAMLVCVWMSK